MAEKIVQTAGRDALGTFAPEFAHYNDDILFGENWNNEDIDLKTVSTDLTPSFNLRGAGWGSPGSLAPCTALWFHLRLLRAGLKA